jgi:hypothetical protein
MTSAQDRATVRFSASTVSFQCVALVSQRDITRGSEDMDRERVTA